MDHQVIFGDRILQLIEGDITRIPVDAIVNAANSHLAGGGGVDGAIHRAAGAGMMKELDAIRTRIGHCPTGSAVVTSAGGLPARFVFHAVGPIYRGGKHNEPALLKSCYETCLHLADQHGLASISFPSISTGVYGYPIEEAAAIALEVVAGHLRARASTVRRVVLVQFGRAGHDVYLRKARIFGEVTGGEGIGAV